VGAYNAEIGIPGIMVFPEQTLSVFRNSKRRGHLTGRLERGFKKEKGKRAIKARRGQKGRGKNKLTDKSSRENTKTFSTETFPRGNKSI